MTEIQTAEANWMDEKPANGELPARLNASHSSYGWQPGSHKGGLILPKISKSMI